MTKIKFVPVVSSFFGKTFIVYIPILEKTENQESKITTEKERHESQLKNNNQAFIFFVLAVLAAAVIFLLNGWSID